MTIPILYQFDNKTGEFLYSRPAQTRPNGEPIIDVIDATLTAPPTNMLAKRIACWTGEDWKIVEDHRQKMDGQNRIVEGTGTIYWLPSGGDNFRSEGHYTQKIGPLPNGASLTRPEKTVNEERQDQIRIIKYELESIDHESIRPLRASIDGIATDADVQRLKELEEKAQGLRKQLADILFATA